MSSENSDDNLLKAIALLKHNDKHGLSSKIDYLIEKDVPVNDILAGIKRVSNDGFIQLKNTSKNNLLSKYHLLNKMLPWIAIIGVGLATYYLTGEDSDAVSSHKNLTEWR